MYKELATIKDGNEVTGFVVYKDTDASVIDVDLMKKLAGDGTMDTLFCKDGKLVPTVQDSVADQFGFKSKRALERSIRIMENMTFNDYVNYDCNFRKSDVDLMENRSDTILANICTLQAMKLRNTAVYMMTMAFWSSSPQAVSRFKNVLQSYARHIKSINKMHDYGGFIMLNLPLKDPAHDFDILTLQQDTGLNFLYNMDMTGSLFDRTKHVADCMPFVGRKLMYHMLPDEKDIAIINSVTREANRISWSKMRGTA